MTVRGIYLDRITIDGHRMRRRSATMRFRAAPVRRDQPAWEVEIVCAAAPDGLAPDLRLHRLEATTATGGQIEVLARIVERHDDAFGTRMILAGFDAIATPTAPTRSAET